MTHAGVRKILILAGAAACLTHGVFAKDLPRRGPKIPPPIAESDKWSGPYIGAMAGGADGRSSATSTVACPPGGFLCAPDQYEPNGALLGATASGSTSDAAFTAGVVAGYNWHHGDFVSGVEGDVSSLRLSVSNGGSASSLNLGLVNPAPPPSGGTVPVVATVSATAAINWVATFRGRIGYLLSPDVLIYATGGLALTSLSVSNSYTDNWVYNGGATGNSTVRSYATGYAAGAGIERSLGQSWTLKAEYLRIGFGSLTTNGIVSVGQFPASQNPFTSSANFAANLFRLGLNHKF